MRRSFMPLLALVFAFGCAEGPTAPLLQAGDASFERFTYDNPPPPFEVVGGTAVTEYGAVSFTAHLFVNKPGNVAWLQFQSTTTEGASFSPNARIMSVNGNVTGIGTVSIGGNTVYLRDVDTFNYQTYRTTRTFEFSGGSIRQGVVVGPKVGGIDECGACFIGSIPDKKPGR